MDFQKSGKVVFGATNNCRMPTSNLNLVYQRGFPVKNPKIYELLGVSREYLVLGTSGGHVMFTGKSLLFIGLLLCVDPPRFWRMIHIQAHCEFEIFYTNKTATQSR